MIGEDVAARAAARATVRSSHERPLGSDAAFIEDVLQFLVKWLASAQSPPAGVFSFVRFDFNQERRVANLGPIRRVCEVGPQPGGMHLCPQLAGRVNVVREGLATVQAHMGALTSLQLGSSTMVTFDPTTRVAVVLCGGLSPPLPMIQLPQQPPQPWTIDTLTQTISEFNFDRLAGSSLYDQIMDGARLRHGGRLKYHEALYFYLRYERGIDRPNGWTIRLNKTTLELRPRSGRMERIMVFGRRAAYPRPDEEAGVLGKHKDRLEARYGSTSQGRLHLRCICCDLDGPCAAAIDQASFTMDHSHLEP